MTYRQYLTIPLLLTFLRLLVSPLVLPAILVCVLPYHSLLLNLGAALLFVLFCLTDFFDGYYARRHKQESILGKLLDPIADKCLICATLIALVYTHKLYFYWAILILIREFFVMGIRLVAREYGFVLSVSNMGKLKTAVHTVWLTWVIVNPYQSDGLIGAFWLNSIEHVLLIASLALSYLSLFIYYRDFRVYLLTF